MIPEEKKVETGKNFSKKKGIFIIDSEESLEIAKGML